MHIIVRALAKNRKKRNFRNIFSLTSVWNPKINAETRIKVEEFWKDKINRTPPEHVDPDKKMYVLSMFPYPSGQLHLGHVRVYTISDTYARLYTMHGKQVIHPMGWDSFGLPAENAAVERNENPRVWTERNIQSMKKQLKDLNFNFDWSKELSTCDPKYYKWTQYLFLKLYEKGLVYCRNAVVHWDPVDQTVLADEQVDAEGRSWRSGAKVEKKNLRQWFIRTTYLSKDLLLGLRDSERNNWDEVGPLQRGWIGDCTGFSFEWSVIDNSGNPHSDLLRVWTEEPEFLGAVTFVALSPDHSMALSIENCSSSATGKAKYYALNPISGKKIPVLVSNNFEFPRATNCHLGTPSLSKEDLTFAIQHDIEVIKVVDDDDPTHLINSGTLTGLSAKAARLQVCQQAQQQGRGGYPCSSHLKDWLISRQRYWGTPIPIIHCTACGVVPVPYEQLPVELPALDKVTKEGVSPLCGAHDWLSTPCPRCHGPATRETDTMDTFVDSSWYYLRFLDPKNEQNIVDPAMSRERMPVDLYIGGLEHAVMHLYYARFINHFCHSLGLTEAKEPFVRMLVHGMVVNETFKLSSTGRYLPRDMVAQKGTKLYHKETGEPVLMDWEKMSKSKHNGVKPEDIVSEHGIDTTRLFILCAYSPTSRYKWPSPGDVHVQCNAATQPSHQGPPDIYKTFAVQEPRRSGIWPRV
ncbi:probable leucine--tRNA ligase, mitochondrial isoform X7 [Dermacentor andersoni]|uniref:probable leucine--tRNA ligase, mitochondrial isoform X7 n=1 Tax=Dermacentor andersoni TaxID=34620 RepID=UPI003B3AFF81